MKNQKIIWSVIAVIVIIVIVVFISRGSGSGSGYSSSSTSNNQSTQNNSNTAANPIVYAPVGTTTQVSATTKSYQNPELAFSVDYPATWGLTDSDNGPTFTAPTGNTTSASGVYTLQAQIYVLPGACAFPPVATSTVAGRSTLSVGGLTFKMIKVATVAHSQSYLDEMYTLQQGTKYPSCYVLSFASTASAPVSAANQSIINAATTAFTSMVKSFAIVTGPAGQSETAHPNGQ